MNGERTRADRDSCWNVLKVFCALRTSVWGHPRLEYCHPYFGNKTLTGYYWSSQTHRVLRRPTNKGGWMRSRFAVAVSDDVAKPLASKMSVKGPLQFLATKPQTISKLLRNAVTSFDLFIAPDTRTW